MPGPFDGARPGTPFAHGAHFIFIRGTFSPARIKEQRLPGAATSYSLSKFLFFTLGRVPVDGRAPPTQAYLFVHFVRRDERVDNLRRSPGARSAGSPRPVIVRAT